MSGRSFVRWSVGGFAQWREATPTFVERRTLPCLLIAAVGAFAASAPDGCMVGRWMRLIGVMVVVKYYWLAVVVEWWIRRCWSQRIVIWCVLMRCGVLVGFYEESISLNSRCTAHKEDWRTGRQTQTGIVPRPSIFAHSVMKSSEGGIANRHDTVSSDVARDAPRKIDNRITIRIEKIEEKGKRGTWKKKRRLCCRCSSIGPNMRRNAFTIKKKKKTQRNGRKNGRTDGRTDGGENKRTAAMTTATPWSQQTEQWS